MGRKGKGIGLKSKLDKVFLYPRNNIWLAFSFG